MDDHAFGEWGDLGERFGIDAAAIAHRRAHVGLVPEDDAALASIGDELAEVSEAVVDRFYDHLQTQGDLSTALGDGTVIARLKTTLKDYVASLGQDATELDYFETRLRIGMVHEAIGLAPRHMMEAFAVLFEALGGALGDRARARGEDSAALLRSIAKFMWLDASLATEAYQDASTSRMQVIVERLQEVEVRLREASATDELTGVLNRRELMARLQIEFGRARRYGHPFVLLFADLDRFKRVNDEHGHEAGDEVLKDIAHRLREGTRPADIVGRYGGEEFVIGLVQTGPERAMKIAERLRRAISLQPVAYGDESIGMTISIGVAPLREFTPDLAALIVEADAALYRAKSKGRNAVCLAESEPPVESRR